MKRFIFILVIFIAGLLAINYLRGCAKIRKPEEPKIPVAAVEVKSGDLKEALFYVGDIKAQDEAEVYPRVAGKLFENTMREGDSVKKGDIIAFVDRDEIGFEFEKSPVSSPIDGVIGKIYLDKGVSVSTLTPIAKVVSMDAMKLRVDIIERELPKVNVGQTAQLTVDAYPEEIFTGIVDQVSPVVDLASRTALVEIKIPNEDNRLKPGMFGRVKILVDERKGVLIIPRDSVIKEDSSHYVFVVKGGNKAHRQKIEIGLQENNKFEVKNGLSEGEYVVTMGNARLKEGDTLQIVESFDNIEKTEEQNK